MGTGVFHRTAMTCHLLSISSPDEDREGIGSISDNGSGITIVIPGTKKTVTHVFGLSHSNLKTKFLATAVLKFLKCKSPLFLTSGVMFSVFHTNHNLSRGQISSNWPGCIVFVVEPPYLCSCQSHLIKCYAKHVEKPANLYSPGVACCRVGWRGASKGGCNPRRRGRDTGSRV